MTADGAPKDGWSDRTKRFLTSATGLITAFTALVVAAIGLIRVFAPSGAAPSSSVAAAPAVSPAPGQHATTPGTVIGGPVAAGANPSGSAVTPAVRHHGPLTLNFGYEADLDSVAPNWGVGNSINGDDLNFGGCGCSYDGVNARPESGSDIAPAMGMANYATCASATAYGLQLGPDNTTVGTAVCVRTSEGRYAFLTVTALAHNDSGGLSSVSFDVTVWEKAG